MMRSRGLASRSHGLACAAAVQRGRDAQRPFLLALVLARLAVLAAVFFAGGFAAVLVALAFAFFAEAVRWLAVFDAFLATFFVVVVLRPAEVLAAAAVFFWAFLAGLAAAFAGFVVTADVLTGLVVPVGVAGFFGVGGVSAAPPPPAADSQKRSSGDFS